VGFFITTILKYQLSYSDGLEKLLHHTNSTIAVSVYQAGKILLFYTNDAGQMRITPISYPKPMGVCYHDQKLAIATKQELHLYANSPQLSGYIDGDNRRFENLFFPRVTYHTGTLDLHDITYLDNKITAVNTLFSCICQFDQNYNFTPIWQPHFITELKPQDRCHLNGIAVEDESIKYITALGSGNTRQSWREDIIGGGILMDVEQNKIVLNGLSMPHSPRLYDNKLYLLESAKGELVEIDTNSFEKKTITKLNGLVRGLSIINDIAIIGISKVRQKSTTFSKLDESVRAEHASIEFIDIKSGMGLGQLVFKNSIEEIYDVQLLPDIRSVGIFGLYDERHRQGVTTPDDVFWRKQKQEDRAST
jgi:uncharacterized protein (TIGR03032 family)